MVLRVLMGALFVFSGANKVVPFMETPPLDEPLLSLMTGMAAVGMIKLLGVTEVIFGALLLIGRYVPLALVVLAPVVVNILLLHVTVAPSGLPVAIFLVVAWVVVGLQHKEPLLRLLKK